MSTNSINTNYTAQIALQTLNKTLTDLNSTQNQISTGLAVNGASDNASAWSIAQQQRGVATQLDSVTASLQRAQSTLDVTVSAGQTVSDLLNQIKSKALAGADTGLSTTDRASLASDVSSLVQQIQRVVTDANFNGASLVNTAALPLATLTDANASVFTIQPNSLTLAGPNVLLTAGSTFATATQANALLSLVNSSINNVNATVANFGADASAITSHLNFVSKFQDTLTQNVGNLVDADIAKESAALTALQVKQQLGVQTIGIANSTRTTLLGLFR